jgi:uncharacterized GH25 family protein
MRGSVRGSVVQAESGYPVAGVRVTGTPPGVLPPRTVISARSDQSGAFGFDNLIEGQWLFTTEGSPGEVLGRATVHVFDDALSDVTITVRGLRSDFSALTSHPGADVNVASPPPARPPRAVPGGVRGRVVFDGDGKPLPDATISVVSGEGREPAVLPVTDQDGFFSLDGLPEGEWLLRALGRSGETGTAIVHVFDNALSDVTIEVVRAPRKGGGKRPSSGAGGARPGMHGNLRGRVIRNDTGEPVPNAAIVVVTGSGPAPDIAPESNASGSFTLDGLPAGEWVLRAMTPEGASGEATVHVTAGGVANVVITVS